MAKGHAIKKKQKSSSRSPSEVISKVKMGRKMDPSRNSEILDAALDILATTGYEGMTMDLVAQKAKAGKGALYRRWTSKAELVLEAMSNLKYGPFESGSYPDTGSLRNDMLALFKPQSVDAIERKINIMAGLVSMLAQHSELASAVEVALSGPWVEVQKTLIYRAIERNEISRNADVTLIAHIIPSMAMHRALISRKAFDKIYLTKILDHVVLPSLGLKTERRGQ